MPIEFKTRFAKYRDAIRSIPTKNYIYIRDVDCSCGSLNMLHFENINDGYDFFSYQFICMEVLRDLLECKIDGDGFGMVSKERYKKIKWDEFELIMREHLAFYLEDEEEDLDDEQFNEVLEKLIK